MREVANGRVVPVLTFADHASGEVHVAVDEAGEERAVAQVDDRRALGDLRPNRYDLPVLDDDDLVFLGWRAGAVDEETRLHGDDFGAHRSESCDQRDGGSDHTAGIHGVLLG